MPIKVSQLTTVVPAVLVGTGQEIEKVERH